MNPIELAVDYWFSNIARNYEINCCIAATTIVADALEYFGVDAKPMATDIIVYNAAARPFHQDQVPTDEWPDEAWSIGSDHDRPAGGPGYDGHLVLMLEDKGFVDLTCNQYRKPSKDIRMKAPLWLGFDTGAPPEGWFEFDRGDLIVCYRLRPDQTRWKHAKDYRSPNRKRFAGEIIRHVRGVMEESLAPHQSEEATG
jgi:hypothetical protein